MADTDIASMSLVDWLDDLTVRFLLNLPASELESVPRLCFQVEEAQWFYEDFIRPAAAAAGNPLPSLQLRQFCLQLFQHCPLLSGFTDAQHIAAYEEFLAYKVRVPVRGAILLDQSMDKVLLVKGWKKGANWSFPRGKINKDEKDLDCAIREVYEETGYDIRQAGLVAPEDEDKVRYIDVTMREQHMRLFIFRGVPLDTHFEPIARKEISKIDWYNIKDLPGFKKQRHGNEALQANKFYMVAPFLGQMKKWINEQRRSDAKKRPPSGVSAGEHTIVEALDEETDAIVEDSEAGGGLPAARVDKTDALKKLLSIGGPLVAEAAPPPPSDSNGNSLLALIQGGGHTVPQTPLEQVNAFPQQPETPQPHRPRHPPLGFQQSVPQFPFSPQRLQEQQQRNFSVPPPGVYEPNGFPGQQPTHAVQQPPHAHLQHQLQQQRHSLPGGPTPTPQHASQNGTHSGGQMSQQQGQSGMQQQHWHAQHIRNMSDALDVQGTQGAIRAGPSAPKAEQLPVPKLNAQAMNLLSAFKSGSNTSVPASSKTNLAPRQASVHQNALLDLLQKKTSSQPTPTPSTAPPMPEQVAALPPPKPRQATLNEITRTLPVKLKPKKPASTHSPTLPQPQAKSDMVAAIPTDAKIAKDMSRQRLYDPAHPKQFVRPSAESGKPAEGSADPQVKIMQRALQQARPPPQPTPRSPKPAGKSPRPKASSPVRAKGTENGAPKPAFTILPRPSSAARAAMKSPSPLPPPSPLRNETSAPAGVQLLKRPESVDPVTVQKAAEAVEDLNGVGGTNGDKRGQLLALFGKTPMASPSPPAAQKQQAAPPQTDQSKKNSLLGLFNAGSLATQILPSSIAPPSSHTQELQPPPAPLMVPSRHASSQNIRRTQTPQNLLLDLFNEPAASQNSPGTPISPFTLGTPVHTRHAGHGHEPRVSISTFGSGPMQSHDAPRSRLSSMTPTGEIGDVSAVGSRKTSAGSIGTTTPADANRDFLRSFLNGVAEKEGYGGAGRRV
ncbi:NUDIX domain-containing protein [Teratosphaeria destructans]|uniref:NUDIX domain-containing protein n=1 Tax=Teratosphaeria destructans TaxID=418781 RepID=A0A9W7SUZ0_9PEZI|nr:NUDIX domain-containing protein [Teratosphaeria destructans]